MRLDIIVSIIQFFTATSSVIDATPGAAPPPEPVEASTTGLICDLTQPEVDAIIAHYGLNPDPQALSEALQYPLFCGAYGDLCLVANHIDAEGYVCTVWKALGNLQSEAIALELVTEMLNEPPFVVTCPADEQACIDSCSPHDVLSCGAAYQDGECHPIALCDLELAPVLDKIAYFSFLNTPSF